MTANLKKNISTFEKELLLKNQAIESSLSAIALTDLEGEIVYINSSFLKMFGFDSKNDFMSRYATNFLNKQTEATEIIKAIQETGYWSGELPIKKRDGSELTTIFSANFIRDRSGKPVAMMASFIDISKQKELENDLETIFNSVNDGILISYLKGRFLEVNQIVCDVLGYQKDELMQMTALDTMLPKIRETVHEQVVEKLSQGGGIVETISRCKDGSLIPVELNVRQIQYKGTAAILTVARDITERKEAEALLKSSEEKYSTLVENANDGIVVIQNDLLKFANQKFIDICGFSKDQIIGKSFFDLVSTQYKEIVQERYNQRFSSGNVTNNYEAGLFSKDGNIIPIEISGSIIEFEGKPANMAIIHDITESNRLSEELKRKNKLLQLKLDYISSSENELEDLALLDIIDLEHLQEIQDTFSKANGVASSITEIDGTPITKPSNFSKLCQIVRSTKEGEKNCQRSAILIGDKSTKIKEPFYERCHSIGLIDASAPIIVGGKHIANWLIGQVSLEKIDQKSIEKYARKIGADVDEMLDAYNDVQQISQDKFENVLQLFSLFAKEISTLGYNNLKLMKEVNERKKAEERLQKSESKYRALFQYNSAVMLMMDPDTGNIVDANPAACSYYGYSRKKLTHMKITDINMSSKEKVFEEMENARSEKRKLFFFTHRLSSGEMRNVEVYSCPIIINNKDFLYSTIHDITERKQAESALQESETKYREVVSAIDALFWKADLTEDGNFTNTYLSPFVDTLCGVDEGTIGSDWDKFFSYVHPDDLSNLFQKLDETIKKRSALIYYEYRIIRADGNQLWVYEKVISHINSEGTVQIFGTTVDITELKSIQHVAINERDRAQKYFDVAKVIMLVLDVNGKVVQINKKGIQILGYEEEEMLGKNWCENYLPEDFRKQVEKQIEHLRSDNNKKIEYYENPILNSAGEEKWITWNLSILRNENGDIEGYLCSGQDITERKLFENRLLDAKLNSELANRSKSEFLANMSHELRTPLNSVIGFSDVLCNGTYGELNEKQRRYTENIHKSGQNLLKIINNILDLSAIEARSTELNCEKFLLSEILKDVTKNVIPLATQNNISIDIDAEEMILMNADKNKIYQIMNNLVSNAIKFNDNSSSILVKARNIDNEINISVKDTGIGIPEEEIGKLFDPFYQIDGSSSRNFGGNGIGLALVKHFVKMHKGDVWIESQEGIGTEVHIKLPAEQRI